LGKGEEGILKREALIQFERPFGYQTALSKEELLPQIFKEGKVVWQEGPYKIIEYQGSKYFVSDIAPKNVVELKEDFVKSILLGKTERTFYKADYLIQKGEEYGKISIVKELPAKTKEIYIPIKEEEISIKGFKGKPSSNVLKDLANYYEKLLEQEKLEKAKEIAKEVKTEPSKIAITESNVHVGMPETKLEIKPIVGIKEEIEYTINKELFEKLREGFAGVRFINVVSPKPITLPAITPPKLIQTIRTDVTNILDKDLKPKGFEELIKPKFEISAIKPKLDISQKQIVTPRKQQDIFLQQTQIQTITDLSTEKTLEPISKEIERLKRLKTEFSLPLRFMFPELPKGGLDKMIFQEFRSSKQPLGYEPSLIGLAFGIKAKDIGKLFTGFEIRGIKQKDNLIMSIVDLAGMLIITTAIIFVFFISFHIYNQISEKLTELIDMPDVQNITAQGKKSYDILVSSIPFLFLVWVLVQ